MAETAEQDLTGTRVVSAAGDRVGRISRIIVFRAVDASSEGNARDEAERWALVRLGVLGVHSALVPLEGSEEQDGHLRVPYELEWIKQVPHLDLEGDELTDEQANRLHGHYGLERITAATVKEDDIPDLPRDPREAQPPGLDDSDDNPVNQRRHERMEELGIPSAGEDSDEETGDASPDTPESEVYGDDADFIAEGHTDSDAEGHADDSEAQENTDSEG